MRFAVSAIAALALSTPAHAATIVQNAYSYATYWFNRFDPALGHLDGAHLDMTVDSRRGFYRVAGQPAGTPNDVQVAWTIDGVVQVDMPLLGLGLTTNFIPIYGQGSANLQPLTWLYLSAQGAGSFEIDPAAVQIDPAIPSTIFAWHTYALGLANPALDTVLTMPYPLNLYSDTECDRGRGGDECTVVHYTLTYTYTPVPEPATWAMMLAGFGLLGGYMRRRAAGVLSDRYEARPGDRYGSGLVLRRS